MKSRRGLLAVLGAAFASLGLTRFVQAFGRRREACVPCLPAECVPPVELPLALPQPRRRRPRPYDPITVLYPDGSDVPGESLFFAWGTVQKGYSVTGASANGTNGKLVTGPAVPAGMWAYYFPGITAGDYTVTVTGQDSDQNPITEYSPSFSIVGGD